MAQGITTLTALGESAATTQVTRIRPETFERIRSQAALQLHFTRTGERLVELLPDEEDRGFRVLPPPSEGDVWLDLEGHPFYEPARGLEYLFGWCYRDGRRDPLRGRLGPRPRRREGRVRAVRRLGRGAPPRLPRPPRLPLRGVRANRAPPADGRALDTRARDRRLAAAGAARRPLPRREAGAAGRRHELLDQGDREAVRVRAHGGGRGRRRVGRPLRAVARGAGATRCSRGSAPTTRRTAARRSRSTSGCSGCARRSCRGGCRRRSASRSEEAEERDATRIALHEALLAGGEEGSPQLAARPPPLLPPARGEVAVVGVVPSPLARRGRADRGHGHDRRARARRRAGRGRAVARLHVHVPAAGAQDRRTLRSTRGRRTSTSCPRTTSAGP